MARRKAPAVARSNMRGLLKALWVACSLLTGGVPPVSSETRRVILLFDERQELPGLAAIDPEFVKALNARPGDRVEIYREQVDASRFDDHYRARLRNFMAEKYADRKIDVVVTVFRSALDFVLGDDASTKRPFPPGTPVVFAGLDADDLAGRTLPPEVRGVLLKRAFAPTLELALRVHPNTRRVVVVGGTSAFDLHLLDDARREFQAYEDRVTFDYTNTLPFDQLLTQLANLPPGTIVLYTTVFQDGAGQPFVPHDAVARVSAAANVPVYGFLDQYVGRGIVGGTLYSLASQGTEAARFASDLLKGAHSESRISELGTSEVVFDWRQMNRWKIAAGDVPEGSEIRYRDLRLWEQYPGQTAAGLGVIVAQAAIIFLLLHEHRRRRSAEMDSRRRAAELIHVGRHATAGECPRLSRMN